MVGSGGGDSQGWWAILYACLPACWGRDLLLLPEQ